MGPVKNFFFFFSVALSFVFVPAAVPFASDTGVDKYGPARERMIQDHIKARGVKDEAVLGAMRAVPRHEFVASFVTPEAAYGDHPLPIGEGQTISQPFIVAYMTELLKLKPGQSVLEVGTGSGYQAAVLAEITGKVYSIEIIEALSNKAAKKLKQLGYTTVMVKSGDGYQGWEEYAPFDAIIVTAAPGRVPPPLLAQLKDGGRLVMPIEHTDNFQVLTRITKKQDAFQVERLMGVRFVPMTGEVQTAP